MKRQRRSRPLPVAVTPRRIQRKVTQAQLTGDIATSAAATIYHRAALIRQAMSGTGASRYEPELFTMVAEKMLAGGEAAALAMRQMGPLQRAWTDFWFAQWQHVPFSPQAWLRLGTLQEFARLYVDCVAVWSKTSDLFDAALLSHTRPIHRTVSRNARRLG